MSILNGLSPERVFYYFEEICNIPHGSGNTEKIAEFCVDFAKKHNLAAIKDNANNVVIYKDGTNGYKNSVPLILQGHIDMVCQKTPETDINFETDGLKLVVDGDFIKAKGTTLGADNGIAAAMMLAILESNELTHPPIEALFTSDEEIGMIGARKFDTKLLKGKRMINLDVGRSCEAIVSCAGGSDVTINIPITRKIACGKKLSLLIKGLSGGHSGTAINEGRINANILAGRLLNYAKKICDFDIIEINGGDKGNAIPVLCKAELVVNESETFISKMEDYFDVVKEESSDSEENLSISIRVEEDGNFNVISKTDRDKVINFLLNTPNGVVDMSKKINNLVETSLNLGILATADDKVSMLFALRSSKKTALEFLEERLCAMADFNECSVETSGHYPPWEYAERSEIREKYLECYKNKFGTEPDIEAVHAGLECGVFASKIEDFDCVSIGPDMYDIHTVDERLSISGTKNFYEFLTYFISNIK